MIIRRMIARKSVPNPHEVSAVFFPVGRSSCTGYKEGMLGLIATELKTTNVSELVCNIIYAVLRMPWPFSTVR